MMAGYALTVFCLVDPPLSFSRNLVHRASSRVTHDNRDNREYRDCYDNVESGLEGDVEEWWCCGWRVDGHTA